MRSSAIKQWAKSLTREIHALYLAARDPRTPWHAKAVGLIVVGYALSPIDLIPDFIPVLGYLDDVILLPLGILLFRKLVPAEVMERCRVTAREAAEKRCPSSKWAGLAVVLVWCALFAAAVFWGVKWWQASRVRAG